MKSARLIFIVSCAIGAALPNRGATAPIAELCPAATGTPLPKAIPPPPKPQVLSHRTAGAGRTVQAFIAPRILQQVDDERAIGQAQRLDDIVLTGKEKERQARGAACRDAFSRLERIFASHRKAIGYPDGPDAGLADFASWWAGADETQRLAAEPVVRAQREYGEHCLSAEIPPDMNPALLKASVGVVSYEDKVICTALRTGEREILTARHCFVSPETGALNPASIAARRGSGRFWFIYEAEPDRKFEICARSLPQPSHERLEPPADNVRLEVARTRAPVPRMSWKSTGLKPGDSLYLRGHFAFAPEGTTLGSLRATMHGGCVVTAQRDRCVFHACQSLPIMSGAPIFYRPDADSPIGELEVAALHLGPASLGERRYCQMDGTRVDLSNFGYRP